VTVPEPEAGAHRRISDTGRLFSLLKAAIDARLSDSVLEALAVASGASKSERESGYRTLAELHRLVTSAKTEIQAHPELKQDLYLGSINSVGNVLNGIIPTNPWDTVVQQLAQPMISLEFCADQLNRLSDEPLLGKAAIQDLLKEIQELEAALLEAQLEPDLTRLLLGKLTEMRGALIKYHIDGAAGLTRAAESAIGGVVKHGDAIKKAGRVKQLLDFLELLIKFDTVVAKLSKYAELAAPVIQRFLPPGGGAHGAG